MSVRKAKVSNHDTGFSIKAKPFFEIFSHARVYVRDDDENKKIYFLYIFLFFYFSLLSFTCYTKSLSEL